jgi:uncharacterized protein
MMEIKRILVTGSSGLIGSKLTGLLERNGYEIVHLGRSTHGKQNAFVWDVEKGIIDEKAFEGVHAIIHLAGANVGEKRWTTSRKKEILESRTKSTQLLFRSLQELKHQVNTFISASAIGYYGFEGNEWFTERSKPGADFLAGVTNAWEEEVDKINTLGIRTAKIRIGIVLSREDGALKPMEKAVKLFAGAPLGSGDQFMSWIHIDDLCGIFRHVLKHKELQGPFNATAPNPVTNSQLTQALAATLGKPLIVPQVPAFALRLLFGEMADIIVKGSRVSSEEIVSSGFKFKFTNIKEALTNLYSKQNGQTNELV